MKTVFADTSFYLALLKRDDALNTRAFNKSRISRQIVTTELILIELGNACSRAEDHADFVLLVQAIRATPRIRIVPFTTSLLDRGLKHMEHRKNKDWSLTDCISFIVMEDLGITDALTGDKHFEQAGFAALLR